MMTMQASPVHGFLPERDQPPVSGELLQHQGGRGVPALHPLGEQDSGQGGALLSVRDQLVSTCWSAPWGITPLPTPA